MAKTWSKTGTWAIESEKADAEERERNSSDSSATRPTLFAGESLGNFPSLNEAAATKQKKKNDVNRDSDGSFVKQIFDSKGLTTEEKFLLPTGPRERTADALDHSRHGGGFRSYGYGNRVYDWRGKDRSGFLSSSKADEVDNWCSGKKTLAPLSGIRDSFGFGMKSGRWGRGNVHVPRNGEREMPRFELDLPNGDSAGSRPSPFCGARPREEVLAEKGFDWKMMEVEIERNRVGGFTNSSSSRPSSARSSSGSQVSSDGGASRTRPKVNPFGDAKPREVVLEEKGLDWRKIDEELEHRGIDRPETDEERKLKEEIDNLRKELDMETETNMNGDSSHHPTEQYDIFLGQIRKREKELENLTHELDDKLRFGKRAFGDTSHDSASADKISVQTGLSKDLRKNEFAERPRSRGTGDSWSKPMNEKRGSRSSRDSGFLTSRIMDRPRSRERW